MRAEDGGRKEGELWGEITRSPADIQSILKGNGKIQVVRVSKGDKQICLARVFKTTHKNGPRNLTIHSFSKEVLLERNRYIADADGPHTGVIVASKTLLP